MARSSNFTTWRAWVKFKGGDVREYDKQYLRFKRFKKYTQNIDINFDPKREAAYTIVYGDRIYEDTRREFVKRRHWTADMADKLYGTRKTSELNSHDGYISVTLNNKTQTFAQWREDYFNDKITKADFNKVITMLKSDVRFIIHGS